jgi:hypothetical protein
MEFAKNNRNINQKVDVLVAYMQCKQGLVESVTTERNACSVLTGRNPTGTYGLHDPEVDDDAKAARNKEFAMRAGARSR